MNREKSTIEAVLDELGVQFVARDEHEHVDLYTAGSEYDIAIDDAGSFIVRSAGTTWSGRGLADFQSFLEGE